MYGQHWQLVQQIFTFLLFLYSYCGWFRKLSNHNSNEEEYNPRETQQRGKKNMHTPTSNSFGEFTFGLFVYHFVTVGMQNLVPATSNIFGLTYFTYSPASHFYYLALELSVYVCMHKYKRTIIRSRMHRHECVPKFNALRLMYECHVRPLHTATPLDIWTEIRL